jgi:hypothetical protein
VELADTVASKAALYWFESSNRYITEVV